MSGRWDHLMGPPDGRPTVEAWTILSMAAASTRHVAIGTFVLNVMNRHPALVARMASTLQIASGGRFILGIGVGAETGEHAAYGMELPEISDRAARLEEAVAVMRALWSGGPVTRESAYYPLRDAVALPAPDPMPRIVIAGESPAGARRAARIGDGWTASDTNFEARLADYLGELDACGQATRGPARAGRGQRRRLARRRVARGESVGQDAPGDVGSLARRGR